MKQAVAVLLLLAVAASQADSTNTINGAGLVNISTCPLTYYGHTYSWLNLSYTQSSELSVCFTNDPAEIPQDCLLVGDTEVSDTIDWAINPTSTTAVTNIQSQLSHIGGNADCHIALGAATHSSSYVNMILFNLGTAMVLGATVSGTGDLSVNAMVGNSSRLLRNVSNSAAQFDTFFDLTGCRVSDMVLDGNSEKLIPGTCTKAVCNGAGVGSIVSLCGAMEVCQDNMCVEVPAVCTVTGSTVIDFFGRIHSIPDRCYYTLVGNQGWQIGAVFAERRRKDVPFLYEVAMDGSSSSLSLLPGGRVKDESIGQIIELNTTTQWIQGVEFSKDHTGVTAKLPSTNKTIYFDGTTLHVSGFAENVGGLCGNPTDSSTTTSLRAMQHSFDDCHIQLNDTVDGSIDCNRSTEHCHLMRQAPFTACHLYVDPEPYITACTDTLCSYPAVDNLNCQLLEAYVKACNLRGNVTLEDWRSTAGCSAVPEGFCQDHDCSSHEFCGENLGSSGCLCRATFASKYRPTNALGEPAVCMQNSASLTLAGCLLVEKGIDYSNLHLKDPSCTGHMDPSSHMLTFSFDSSNNCGTEVMTNNSQIIYKNTIMSRNNSLHGVITRHDQVEIDFSCFYQMPDVRSVSFRIKDSSVVQKIASGVWNYTLIMSAYTDPSHTELIGPNTEIQLNQKVWMELKAEELDDNLVVIVTDSCWATGQPSPDSTPQYDLIMNKCPNPVDQTVHMEGNGEGTSNFFSFNMFEFSGRNSEIYLHCQVELCPTQGPSPCAPTCSHGYRRRRSLTKLRHRGESALITMAWSN